MATDSDELRQRNPGTTSPHIDAARRVGMARLPEGRRWLSGIRAKATGWLRKSPQADSADTDVHTGKVPPPFRFREPVSEIFRRVRERHDSIIPIDDDRLKILDDEAQRIESGIATETYLAAIISVLFFFATAPLFGAWAYEHATSWTAPLVARFANSKFFDHHPAIAISCILVSFSGSVYTLILPSRWSRESMWFAEAMCKSVNRKAAPFVIATVVLNYLSVTVLMTILYIGQPHRVPERILIAWVSAPFLLIAILPAVLFLITMAFLLRTEPSRWARSHSEAVTVGLVALIEVLDNLRQPLREDQAVALSKWIARIAQLMKGINSAGVGDVDQWCAQETERSAKCFEGLIVPLHFSTANSQSELTQRLCSYLNIFISGTYNDLPRQANNIPSSPAITKWPWIRKPLILFVFICYLLLPILALELASKRLHLEVPPWIQSSLTVLYLVWAVAGAFSFSEHFSPDERTLSSASLRLCSGESRRWAGGPHCLIYKFSSVLYICPVLADVGVWLGIATLQLW